MYGYSFGSWYGSVLVSIFEILEYRPVQIFKPDPIGFGILNFGHFFGADIMHKPYIRLLKIKTHNFIINDSFSWNI